MAPVWLADQPARGLKMLSRAGSRGFACLPALELDPVWQPAGTEPAFVRLRDQVARSHRDIKADFERMGDHDLLAA
jgi:hypothetical protein